jgi:predicted kinase
MTYDEIVASLAPKTALIVRGIPGSGKSTFIERLAQERPLERVAFDDFRGVGEDYKYSPKDQPRVNNKTANRFRELLRKGTTLVAVEGVFGSHDKINQYRQMARARGFKPVIVTVTATPEDASERGVHGVDLDKTQGMHESISKPLPDTWEHYELEDAAPEPTSAEGEYSFEPGDTDDRAEPLPVEEPVEAGPVDTLAPSELTEKPAVQPNWKLAAECLLAVTTPWPGGPISPEHGAEAEEIFIRLEDAAAEFCKFDAFGPFEMQQQIADFKAGYVACASLTPEEYELYTGDLVAPELIMEWANACNRARAYLRFIWPVNVRETPTGPEWDEPSTTQGNKTAACLAMVKRPEDLFREMASGATSPEMFEGVKEVFPELQGRMKAIMEAALKQAGVEGKKCPWSHEFQLRSLFDVPPTELMTFGNDDSESQPPKKGEFKIKFDALMTRGQSVK